MAGHLVTGKHTPFPCCACGDLVRLRQFTLLGMLLKIQERAMAPGQLLADWCNEAKVYV